jgi:hypothetical protein
MPSAFIQGFANNTGEYHSQLSTKLAIARTAKGSQETWKSSIFTSISNKNRFRFQPGMRRSDALVRAFERGYIEFFHGEEGVGHSGDGFVAPLAIMSSIAAGTIFCIVPPSVHQHTIINISSVVK